MQRNMSDRNCLSDASIPQVIKQFKKVTKQNNNKKRKKDGNTFMDLLAWCDTAAQT